MEELHIFNAFKKLFKSIVLDRYGIDGHIKVVDFLTDTYVDVEKEGRLPQLGVIEIYYEQDLTRYHQMFDTYDENYAEFFESGLYESAVEKATKYIGQLPLYHDFFFIHTNKEKLVEEIPTIINNINYQFKKLGYDKNPNYGHCKVTEIQYEDEHNESTKHGMTRMIIHNSCKSNEANEVFHQISLELYEDMVFLSKPY